MVVAVVTLAVVMVRVLVIVAVTGRRSGVGGSSSR